jgi:cell division protein ZapE
MGLAESYHAKLADGSLKPDAAQADVMAELVQFSETLNNHPPINPSIIDRWLKRTVTPPQGIYLVGEVGRGKTMLMDMLFDSIVTWPKQRIHFHAFMQQVHTTRNRLGGDKVIERIASEISASAKFLCLDEMQITDIADAMIIGRLYDALRERGVVVVTTANLRPDQLYRDGLNRDLFLPFIKRIENTMQVINLAAARDYRLGRVRARETYLNPITAATTQSFNTLWQDLTDKAAGAPDQLTVLGRPLNIPRVAHGCAQFGFADLCEQPLGPPDFLAIAQNFSTVFLSGLPKLKPHQRNETKRFILMIDTFYDAGTRLVILADVPPEEIAAKSQHGFEFARTVSRLKEMQSSSWWGTTFSET